MPSKNEMKNAVSAEQKFKYFSKRNLLGALLFLLFVGEGTVGFANGLFTPPGLLVLGGLYLTLFWFYEALIAKFKLTYVRLIPLTFALYAVLITGLLHGELANFAKGEAVITILIRIQCSLFPIFAYYILNRHQPRTDNPPSVITTGLMLLGFFALLTPSKQFGFINLVETIQKVPTVSVIFIVLAVVSVIWSLRPAPMQTEREYKSKSFNIATNILLFISCIPALTTFLILLLAMPAVTFWHLRFGNFRRTQA